MFKWIMRLYNWLRSHRAPLSPVIAQSTRAKRRLRVSVSCAAASVGDPFEKPWREPLPLGYFWKRDEGAIGFAHWLPGSKPRVWRIYHDAAPWPH